MGGEICCDVHLRGTAAGYTLDMMVSTTNAVTLIKVHICSASLLEFSSAIYIFLNIDVWSCFTSLTPAVVWLHCKLLAPRCAECRTLLSVQLSVCMSHSALHFLLFIDLDCEEWYWQLPSVLLWTFSFFTWNHKIHRQCQIHSHIHTHTHIADACVRSSTAVSLRCVHWSIIWVEQETETETKKRYWPLTMVGQLKAKHV